MKVRTLALLTAGPLALGACSGKGHTPATPPPTTGPGAIAGTVAADRNGDGVIDGYYTSDGAYHAFQAPPCPPPPVS
jgi:hypothetical protein